MHSVSRCVARHDLSDTGTLNFATPAAWAKVATTCIHRSRPWTNLRQRVEKRATGGKGDTRVPRDYVR